MTKLMGQSKSNVTEKKLNAYIIKKNDLKSSNFITQVTEERKPNKTPNWQMKLVSRADAN